ncbi:hypothetical protein F4553_005824 [Allocatelliglobosispora scoriae]|uniref:Uncharacterized protein n=1 Tax=Allocatelliglobosispora scoriae TaxID=643052 RepID=A0A841C0C0_9ACTN|nr:hypothetical protein [Allocatelliglobosispora scoriae]MBB5872390.1 hypothetical protein [Allocatelliglobosispora scoriae]
MGDDETVRFTDEDSAFLRNARFGELPPRVTREQQVELQETDTKRDLPEPAGDPREWTNLQAGG